MKGKYVRVRFDRPDGSPGRPLFDIRQWSPDRSRFSKGLRLREDEVRLLDQYAMIMGLTRHQALVGLVRALVVDEPQFTIGEMEALNASNYDLRKLGVNVNQIAHHVNMLSKEKVSELNSKQLSELLKNLNEKSDYINSFIKTHTQKIWKLIKSSRDRTSLNSIRLRHGK